MYGMLPEWSQLKSSRDGEGEINSRYGNQVKKNTVDFVTADPCAPNKDSVTVVDPLDNTAYYFCYKGKGHRASCHHQKIFDEAKGMCVFP